MPLITEISSDSCSSVEVSREALAVTRKSEELEIQSEGINLCFIEKHGIEREDKGFISDTLSSDDGMHIFGKRSSFQRQLCVPMIQEIDSRDVADSCEELLVCDHGDVETDRFYSVNVHSSGNIAKEEASDSSFLCKFFASLP